MKRFKMWIQGFGVIHKQRTGSLFKEKNYIPQMLPVPRNDGILHFIISENYKYDYPLVIFFSLCRLRWKLFLSNHGLTERKGRRMRYSYTSLPAPGPSSYSPHFHFSSNRYLVLHVIVSLLSLFLRMEVPHGNKFCFAHFCVSGKTSMW